MCVGVACVGGSVATFMNAREWPRVDGDSEPGEWPYRWSCDVICNGIICDGYHADPSIGDAAIEAVVPEYEVDLDGEIVAVDVIE